MRHSRTFSPSVGTLTLTVIRPSCGCCLVSPPGRSQLSLPGALSTLVTAIALTTITTDADCEELVALDIAASAEPQTSRIGYQHRALTISVTSLISQPPLRFGDDANDQTGA
jgi:hypothetical protein